MKNIAITMVALFVLMPSIASAQLFGQNAAVNTELDNREGIISFLLVYILQNFTQAEIIEATKTVEKSSTSNSSASNSSSSNTENSSTNTSGAAKGTYRGYMTGNGFLNHNFITGQNYTRAMAVSGCQGTHQDNPALSLRCTWNNEVVYDKGPLNSSASNSSSSNTENSSTNTSGAAKGTYRGYMTGNGFLNHNFITGQNYTRAMAVSGCQGTHQDNPALSLRCTWNNEVVYDKGPLNSSASNSSSSNTENSSTNTSGAAKGTYRGYMTGNGFLNHNFITGQNYTRAMAVSGCQGTHQDNPALSLRCTWNNEVVYDKGPLNSSASNSSSSNTENSSTNTSGAAKGTYRGYMTGNGFLNHNFITGQNYTRAMAVSGCQGTHQDNPALSLRCTWNNEVVYDKGPLNSSASNSSSSNTENSSTNTSGAAKGTYRGYMTGNGFLNHNFITGQNYTRAMAVSGCQGTHQDNPALSLRCTWNNEVVYDKGPLNSSASNSSSSNTENSSTNTSGAAKGTYRGYMTGNGFLNHNFITGQNYTRAMAVSGCQGTHQDNPALSLRCTWNNEVVYDKGPLNSSASNSSSSNTENSSTNTSGAAKGTYRGYMTGNGFLNHNFITGQNYTRAMAVSGCQGTHQDNPALSLRCTWNNEVVYDKGPLNSSASNSSSSNTENSSTNTSGAAKDNLRVYIIENGQETSAYRRDNISLSNSLTQCKAVHQDEPESHILCKWGDKVIYDKLSAEAAPYKPSAIDLGWY